MSEQFIPLQLRELSDKSLAILNNNFQKLYRVLRSVETGAGIPGSRLALDSISAEHYHELRNTYVHSGQDSLDATYPFELDFEIVSEMTTIQSVKLSFRIRNFRAYAKGAASGGGATSGSGGGTTVTSANGGGTTVTSASGGGQTKTSTSTTHNHSGSTASSGGSHQHIIKITRVTSGSYPMYVADFGDHMNYEKSSGDDINKLTEYGEGAHTHDLNISNDGAHTHSVTIDDHTHSVTIGDHTHSVTIGDHTHTTPDHTHNLTFGIYEDSQSPTINVYIDNGSGYGTSIGSYTEDQLDIDITSHISGTGFKRIKFTSNLRTRISAWVMSKVDITA